MKGDVFAHIRVITTAHDVVREGFAASPTTSNYEVGDHRAGGGAVGPRIAEASGRTKGRSVPYCDVRMLGPVVHV